MKNALIVGISGQDGSYLAEFLLEKEYKVIGIIRRHSVAENQTERIEHLRNKIDLHYGDLTDLSSLLKVCSQYQFDEVYNLGAMSNVGISFKEPLYTQDANYLGFIKLIEALQLTQNVFPRFYQASSSEMFGNCVDEDGFQRETTPMMPVSPYGISKLSAHVYAQHLRRAYNLPISSGILFNHETMAEFMPVIIKKDNLIHILPISEVVTKHLNNTSEFNKEIKIYQEVQPTNDILIWDKNGWTKILYGSGYPHLVDSDNKNPILINSKNASYFATGSHHCIMEDGNEKSFENIEIGDKVSLVEKFEYNNDSDFNITEKEAELIGFIIADGYVRKSLVRLTKKSEEVLSIFEDIFFDVYGVKARRTKSTSGFTKRKDINQWNFNCKNFTDKYIFYNEYKEKVIPYQILNSNIAVKKAFLSGYYIGDGLKKDKTIYEYKSFKTNSSTLALGLIYLFKEVYDLNYNVNSFFHNNKIQYQVNLLSNSKYNSISSIKKYELVNDMLKDNIPVRRISRETNISRSFIKKVKNGYVPDGKHHLSILNNSVKKILSWSDYDGWFFDLTTETGTFHAGIGQGHVHNSPRRGTNFVTGKVTKAVAEIKLGLRDKLELGTLSTFRDWGHSFDFTKVMWQMLNECEPDDFICCTGVTHSVEELCELAFSYYGLNYKDYVVISDKYKRDEELNYLRGCSDKLFDKINVSFEYDFKKMIFEMVDYHYKKLS
jgi:GDPmannose 4,6-dehydratase